jgi:preprotein translocase subunit SecG
MIVRMLMLLVLIAQMKLNTIDASDDEGERENMGGEGFANIVQLVVLLGVLLLAVLIVLGILSLTGQFDQEFIDPEV